MFFCVNGEKTETDVGIGCAKLSSHLHYYSHFAHHLHSISMPVWHTCKWIYRELRLKYELHTHRHRQTCASGTTLVSNILLKPPSISIFQNVHTHSTFNYTRLLQVSGSRICCCVWDIETSTRKQLHFIPLQCLPSILSHTLPRLDGIFHFVIYDFSKQTKAKLNPPWFSYHFQFCAVGFCARSAISIS